MSSTASQQHPDDSVWVLLFSSVGHLLNHLCIAFYFVIVLALEVDWQRNPPNVNRNGVK